MFGTVGLRCGQLSSVWWWLLLCCLVANVASFSCPYACPDPPRCFGTVDTNTCQYGVQPDTEGCNCGCTYCARGPDEQCGAVDGACGEGLQCVGETYYDPGLCMFVAATPEATTGAPTASTTVPTTTSTSSSTTAASTPHPVTASTSAASPRATSLGGTISAASTTEGTTSTAAASPTDGCPQQPTVPSSAVGEEDTADCRPKCSVSFCNNTKKQKICSARGMEFSRVEARGTCQHTSCRACFLQVSPPSSCVECGSLPTKRCLAIYYKCIRRHVEEDSPFLLALDSPEAQSHQGRIVCHVPQVTQSQET